MTKNIKTPKNALAIFAHPDDMDFSSSGTIAKWVAKGTEVTYLVCTDGSKGSDDPTMTPRRLAAIRRKEQRDAAKILGVRDVIFLGRRDGELAADLKLKEEIVRVIRMKKPELVITLDPAFFYSLARGFINHSDHRAAGQAAMDAVFPLARDRLNFPQHEKRGLAPHKVKTLFLVSFDAPSHWEDIDTTIEKKISALTVHKSQVGPEALKRIRARGRLLGKKAGMRYAEGFKRIDIG
ncbi:MAG: PIG-L deacetylase family protein [Patescibacteria group bacterium]